MFVIGKFFPVSSNKHSSLLQKSIIYGQKSFITLGPGVEKSASFHKVVGSFESGAKIRHGDESDTDNDYSDSDSDDEQVTRVTRGCIFSLL